MSQYRSNSDEDLVRLLSRHDHAAFVEIYDRYAGLLYVHARGKLRCRETARDLVQELFTAFWKNRATLNLRGSLSAYLYTAVRYRVINAITRKNLEHAYLNAPEQLLHAPVENVQADHHLREQQLKRLIEAEIDQLPERMRQIFRMSRQEHLTHKEIATELKLSEATVKKQVNNALKVLRVKLRPLLSLLLGIM